MTAQVGDKFYSKGNRYEFEDERGMTGWKFLEMK